MENFVKIWQLYQILHDPMSLSRGACMHHTPNKLSEMQPPGILMSLGLVHIHRLRKRSRRMNGFIAFL